VELLGRVAESASHFASLDRSFALKTRTFATDSRYRIFDSVEVGT